MDGPQTNFIALTKGIEPLSPPGHGGILPLKYMSILATWDERDLNPQVPDGKRIYSPRRCQLRATVPYDSAVYFML